MCNSKQDLDQTPLIFSLLVVSGTQNRGTKLVFCQQQNDSKKELLACILNTYSFTLCTQMVIYSPSITIQRAIGWTETSLLRNICIAHSYRLVKNKHLARLFVRYAVWYIISIVAVHLSNHFCPVHRLLFFFFFFSFSFLFSILREIIIIKVMQEDTTSNHHQHAQSVSHIDEHYIMPQTKECVSNHIEFTSNISTNTSWWTRFTQRYKTYIR